MFSAFGALVLHTPTPLYATAIAGALLGFLKWRETDQPAQISRS